MKLAEPSGKAKGASPPNAGKEGKSDEVIYF
jgi:hypothetical protein